MTFTNFNRNSFLRVFAFALAGFVSLTLSGCDLATNSLQADRSNNMEIQDYRDALSSRVESDSGETMSSAHHNSIPKLQPYIAESSETMRSMPIVSISVNQSVPIRDILYELADQAGYDLELDPNIRGSVIFTARERPFDEVIERLSEVAGLRYKLGDEYLRVEKDTPYNKVHKIEYLSYIRNSSGSVRNDIAVVSGDGADTGSDFEASSEVAIDFWGELETNIQQILSSQRTFLRTNSDPAITVVEQNPDVAPVGPADGNIQPPDAVLRVDSLPVDSFGGGASPAGVPGTEGSGFTYAINKQAGLVSVYAPEAAQKEIAEYLDLLRRAVTSQVLIEAKILQVSLSDANSTGVDWSTVTDGIFGDINTVVGFGDTAGIGNINTLRLSGGIPAPASATFLAGYTSNDIQALVTALSTFGTVRALASPRMTVLNNQPAVLNVATNEVFFDIEIDRTEGSGDGDPDTVEIESEIRNVPVGVLVNVQPSINLDTKTISMAIRPTITAVSERVQNPAVIFAAEDAGIEDITETFGDSTAVPELNVQEIDTVIQVNSGDAIVMGGLLSDRSTTDERAVPVLGEIPMVGALFREHDDTVLKTELVIFLKATILDNPHDSIHNTDKDLYRGFSGDRRPFRL